MDVMVIVGGIALVIGIVAGIVQIIDYIGKARQNRTLKQEDTKQNPVNINVTVQPNESLSSVGELRADQYLEFPKDREQELMNIDESYAKEPTDISDAFEGQDPDKLARDNRIQKLLSRVGDAGYPTPLATWHVYLRRNLIFPFDAKIRKGYTETFKNTAQRIVVRRIIGIDKTNGITVQILSKDNLDIVPLFALDALDRSSQNYQVLNDYHFWLKNHYQT